MLWDTNSPQEKLLKDCGIYFAISWYYTNKWNCINFNAPSCLVFRGILPVEGK